MSDIPEYCTGRRIETATGDRPQSPSAKPSQNIFFPREIPTMSKVKLIATLAFCVFLTPAFAQSLADREARAYAEKKVAENVDFYLTKKCKLTIPVKFDWSTFKDFDFTGRKDYVPGNCSAALDGMARICGTSEDALKSVQSKIKSVTCKNASPSTLALENGELVYGIDFDKDSNITERVEKFLMEKL